MRDPCEKGACQRRHCLGMSATLRARGDAQERAVARDRVVDAPAAEEHADLPEPGVSTDALHGFDRGPPDQPTALFRDPATVHGALLSGLREARKVADIFLGSAVSAP